MCASDHDPPRTPESTADDYRSFVTAALGAPSPSVPVVANSQGAVFGLAAAAQGWARTLVLVSPADETAYPAVRALLPEEARALPGLVQNTPDAARELLRSFTPQIMRDMVVNGAEAQDQTVYTDPAFDAVYQAALEEGFAGGGSGYVSDTMMATARWSINLSTITTPVAVLFGTRDQVHSPDHGAILTERLANVRRSVIKDAGSALLWTHADLVFDTPLQQPHSL